MINLIGVKMAGRIDPRKFGEGYNKFEKYLVSELYKGIDGFIANFPGKFPEEQYDAFKKVNNEYKSTLKSARRKLKGSVDKIDSLLKKSKGARTEEDAKKLQERISEEYRITLQVSAAIYQILSPEIDAFNRIINEFYTKDLKDKEGKVVIKGLDKGLFFKGCGIIKEYFIPAEMVKQPRQQQASA